MHLLHAWSWWGSEAAAVSAPIWEGGSPRPRKQMTTAEVSARSCRAGREAPRRREGPAAANGVRRRWLRFRQAEWSFNYYCYFKAKLWLLGASQFYRAHFIFPMFIWIICPLLAIKNAIYPITTSSSLYKHSIVLMSSEMNPFVYRISPEFVTFMV